MIRSTQVTPHCNSLKIENSYNGSVENPYYRPMENPYYNTPVENPYNRSIYFTQKPNYPANSNSVISINITLEHLLTIVVVFIVLFAKGENLNTKDFINKHSMDIGKILNILGIFKTEESNSDMSPIMNMLSKIKTKGGHPIVPDKNINPTNLIDIIKQAVEIANELKKDPSIVDTIKSSKEKVDTNTIENITNKLKNSDENKNIDPSKLESIVEQAVVIANELKKNNV
ncbi:hypothetical protein HNQ80_000815 [Anaerosolibacter carboniphilus]|uniref:Uncharacterized protein n=1 Tax=Anaerosolibacter carboniphilus TaxID=1417629 RepID=A0A841KUY4_9FIRM|nr:hypothetical protein [Anaerosolibacter carboniphilus]MBB6214732.1 hypothetical protein [Anaerosolibacter carboniphilus]